MGDGLLMAVRRRLYRHRVRAHRGTKLPFSPLLLTVLLGIAMATAFISFLELRLRPVVEELAIHQVNNRVTADINGALSGMEAEYDRLVNIQRDDTGQIMAITSDMASINELRGQVVDKVLGTISAIDVHDLGVPLGSLFDLDLVWAKGPEIQVHSLVAGTVSAQMSSEFTSSGINQTLHRIVLNVEVPLTVLLPGIVVKTEVAAAVCVAETVIVGRVPETYLSLGGQDALP